MRQQEDQTHKMDQIEPAVAPKRNNRGIKSRDFYNWPEQPFEEMDSPLAAQQYIQQLIYKDPANVEGILKLPEGQDLGAWKIEHLRMFCMQLNRLAAKLQECCQPETCNQMTATEQWIFLCAAHKQPAECSAIDYTVHTLDGAANLLNSNKYFPSRVTIKESSVAKLASVCRRIYRIFSHAYYHHFQVFDEFERATHLCERFSSYVTMYDLMPRDSLIVPIDGLKPDLASEKVTTIENPQSDTTIIESANPSPAVAASAPADVPNPLEESSKTNDLSKDSLVDATHSKEIDAKKSSTNELDVVSKLKPTVVASPRTAPNVSTNTMVKGSTNAGSRISNSTDLSARKSNDTTTKSTATTTTTTATTKLSTAAETAP